MIIQHKQVRQKAIKICQYKLIVSENVSNQYGDENGYTNTYRYCNKLKKRLVTRSCINCVFFKQKIN
jgi:hypothetical protein